MASQRHEQKESFGTMTSGRTGMTALAHVVSLVTVTIWGSTFVFTKMLLQDGLSPAQIFALRFTIAYVLLAASSLRQWRWFASTLRDELLLVALGVSGGSLYFLTENEALRHTATTNVSLIVCSCPLAAAVLIGLRYRNERMNRHQLAGTLMAVAGVAAVVLNGHFVLHLSPLGDLLALAACLCWAVYSLLIIPLYRAYSSVFITRKVFFYGLVTIIPYFLWKPGFPSLDLLLQPAVAANLLFLGCVASMLCFVLWTWVMKRLGAIVATNYVFLNPIATIVFAWWLLDEQITVWFLMGTALILVGIYLADKKRKSPEKQS